MVERSGWKSPVPRTSLIFNRADRVVGAPLDLVITFFIFRLVGQTKIIGCPTEMTMVLPSSETYTTKIKSTNL